MKIINRISFIALSALLSVGMLADAQEAKYVFYFIGDGMGTNQVEMTELYRGELEGNIEAKRLLFTQFPVATVATTYSKTNGVTDSAASGTALATGTKTANHAIGVAKDRETPLKSIAVRAKEAGRRVGVSSSVGVNHATPAAFYGHAAERNEYNKIGRQLPESNFDFFAGADFWCTCPEDTMGLYDFVQNAGYTIARGYKDYQKKAKKADKMILFQTKEASKIDNRTVAYTIDRTKKDMTLSEIVRAGINFLSKDAPNGFFFMVEGGNIDWECHSNDAAAIVREVEDFDNAIGVAYEFYQQHPDETLIVVTADHETGGLALGSGPYELNLKILKNQKVSDLQFSRILNAARIKNKGKLTWDMAQTLLKENFGYGDAIKLNAKQEKRLREAYEESFGDNVQLAESEYQKVLPLAVAAKQIINKLALVNWASGGHSAAFVPVYAIGVGAEKFSHRTDNAEIPRTIAEIGGYPVTD